MKPKLYMLEETSPFMMSFVIETGDNNVIIVDGGRKEDMPLLKKTVNGRKVKAWILTHPHLDHISGFVSEMKNNGCADFDLEVVYFNFPDYDYLINKTEGVLDRDYFINELNGMLPEFNAITDRFSNKAPDGLLRSEGALCNCRWHAGDRTLARCVRHITKMQYT